ncbi:hypothetical protein C0J52_27331 [Blattella germanica]|nr:hypothetical protein C0J52_27331 [Blattella germanica]
MVCIPNILIEEIHSRRPRGVINPAGKIIKYFIILMKRKSPLLRKKILELATRKTKRSGYTVKRLEYKRTKKNQIVASREKSPGWGWTIFDTLDTLGVFDYFLGGESEEEPVQKKRRRPRNTFP